jgi:hypothetical protein
MVGIACKQANTPAAGVGQATGASSLPRARVAFEWS